MMKMKYRVLVLATSLLAAPALVLAQQTATTPATEQAAAQPSVTGQSTTKEVTTQQQGRYQHKMQRGEGHKGHGNMAQRGSKHMQMSPEHFEQYLTQRLAKLDTPELKAQFIKASQARLTAQAEQTKLRSLMAEHKAQELTDKAIKAATLEKIAADQKLKQLRNQQLQDLLTKAQK